MQNFDNHGVGGIPPQPGPGATLFEAFDLQPSAYRISFFDFLQATETRVVSLYFPGAIVPWRK